MGHFGGYAPFPMRLGGTAEEGWTAAQHARACADLIAIKRTSPLAIITYSKVGATVTITSYNGMNGVGPGHEPTPTVNGTGDVTFTWSDSYEDDHEMAAPWSVTHADASSHGTTPRGAYARALTPTTVRVVTFSLGGAGNPVDAEATVVVY